MLYYIYDIQSTYIYIYNIYIYIYIYIILYIICIYILYTYIFHCFMENEIHFSLLDFLSKNSVKDYKRRILSFLTMLLE